VGWLLLIIAGLSEVASVPLLKYSRGFQHLWPSVAAVAALALSFYCLSRSVMTIPVGTAYAVWTGIGSCGAVVLGAMVYRESLRPSKLICLAIIIIGMIGIRLTS
jgi:multidrug transporter EmrE-like cation transporter